MKADVRISPRAGGIAVFLTRLLFLAVLSWIGGCWAAGLVEQRLLSSEISDAGVLLKMPLLRQPIPGEKGRTASLRDFVSGDPFLAASALPKSPDPAKGDEKSDITAEKLYELEGVRIAGTIPGISVWVEEEGKQSVFLRGEILKGYELIAVEDDRVILHKGPATLTVHLKYSGHETAKAVPPPPLPARRDPTPPPPSIRAAKGGQKGSIPREAVNKLLMDPLDEMKKFRIRPKYEGDKPVGVEVQWIEKSSFLQGLGVEKGDVIQTVNGVEIKNMGDVVNVINSLMGGDTFDVKVLRKGSPVGLTYNVR